MSKLGLSINDDEVEAVRALVPVHDAIKVIRALLLSSPRGLPFCKLGIFVITV